MGEEIFIVDIENAELMEKIKSEGLGDPCFIDKFQKDNPTKVDKVSAIKAMSQAEYEQLISASTNIYGKIFYKQAREGKFDDLLDE